MITRRLIIGGAVLLLVFIGVNSIATAEKRGARAREIEAAFLLQFCKYIKWPTTSFSRPQSPIIVGIFGRDPFGSTLDNLARSSKPNGRTVEIRRLDNIGSITNCHILFVSSSQIGRMAEISAALADFPVLLVSGSQDFLQFGVINFVKVEKKIRFNISRKNCQKAGLKISSKLLKVAHKIE